MNKLIKYTLLLILTTLLVETSKAQINVPAASPTATFSQKIGLSDVKIIYSRPSARGRKIMGELVPYGKMWRTGANEATKISFSDEVTIEGKKLPAGEYALFTLPEQNEWTIIISKNTQLWGNMGYNDQDDAIRFKVKSHKNPNFVETFTINVADVTLTSANIEVMWENTLVKFNVASDVDAKVMAQIDQFSANPEASLANTYFQAASYYYETDRDLNKALDWVNKTLEVNQAYWILHLKAKIQGKMKDYKNAITSAENSMAKAKEAGNDDYVKLNEKYIAEWKNGKK